MSDFFNDPLWQIANSKDPQKELKKYERAILKRFIILWTALGVICYLLCQ